MYRSILTGIIAFLLITTAVAQEITPKPSSAAIVGGTASGMTISTSTLTANTATGVGTYQAVSAGLTASTTQTRTGALALTSAYNVLSTVANSGDAVGLPSCITSTIGTAVVIFNAGADPAAVFPAGSSDTIDGGSGGAKVTLTNAKRAIFYCTAAATWISAQLGLVSG